MTPVTIFTTKELFKNFPEFEGPLKEALRYSQKKAPSVYVYAQTEVEMSGAAYDYSRVVYIFRNAEKQVKVISGGYGEAVLNRSPEERFAESGNIIKLDKFGAVCLRIDTIGSASLYVNPETIAKAFPVQEAIDLDPIEKLVLEITSGFKSAYRREEFARVLDREKLTAYVILHQIDYGQITGAWDKAIEILCSKGLVTKTGAITNKGKMLVR